MLELEGKTAVITGGASGIGEATARLFVAQGARIVIADMQRERGEALAAALGDAALYSCCEVRSEADVKAAVNLAVDRWGRLDCMFNNAGFGGVLGPLDRIPVAEFDLTFDVLVRGVFLGMKHAVPVMKKQGRGSIVNTGSIAGLVAGRGPQVYSAAKAAVIHLSKVAAMELGEHAVRVNCVCPGLIATPLAANTVGRPDSLIEERADSFARQQPIPRAGRPHDIAEAVLFLASDRSSFVTGQAITVDGGAATGVPWHEQNPVYRQYRPIRVYHPDQQ